MSVSRRQFFALVGAGAALAAVSMPEGDAVAATHAKAPRAGKPAREFIITQVRWESFGPTDNDGRVHVEAVEKDGYLRLAFDLATFDYALRPNDILHVEMDGLYAGNWPPPLSVSRGKLSDVNEVTLTIPSLAEREMMEFYHDSY